MLSEKLRTKTVLATIIAGIMLLSSFGAVISGLGTNPAPSFDTVIEAGSMVEDASYVIFTDGSMVYAKDGDSGAVVYSSTNASSIFQSCINDLDAGLIFVKKGTYILTCDQYYTSNGGGLKYYAALGILQKNITLRGEGVGQTILKIADDQHYSGHATLMFWATGYHGLSITDMTWDGNNANQDIYAYDGAGLFLSGGNSLRTNRSNAEFRNLELINSAGSGIYLGNNGQWGDPWQPEYTQWEYRATVDNVKTSNNWYGGIIADTVTNCTFSNIHCENDGSKWYYANVGIQVYGASVSQHYRQDNNIWSNIHLKNCMLDIEETNGLTMTGVTVDCDQTFTANAAAIKIAHCLNVSLSVGQIRKNPDTNTGSCISISYSSNVTINLGLLTGYYGVNCRSYSKVTVNGGFIIAGYEALVSRDNSSLWVHSTLIEVVTADGYSYGALTYGHLFLYGVDCVGSKPQNATNPGATVEMYGCGSRI